jgi:hypothetical protein
MATDVFGLTELDDPAPPVPGAVERAAVGRRARVLVRRRRRLQVGLGVAALVVGGAAVFAVAPGSDSARVQATGAAADSGATVQGTVTVPDGWTAHVSLAGGGHTYEADVRTGTFSLTGVPTGDYLLTWTAESASAPSSNGVEIGSAARSGRLTVTVGPGTNTVDFTI